MKKIITIIFFIFTFLNANSFTIINPNSYFTNSNLNKAYNEILAYEETIKLIEVLNTLLNSSDFKENLYFAEIGKTKINLLDLLKQLKYFLAGWPKYTNTYFDNNSDLAGIRKILKDSIENDSNFLNIPKNVIKDIKKSILNLGFFTLANKIKYNINHKNLKNNENLVKIMEYFHLLLENYTNTISQINIPLLNSFNEKIKDKLERDYRIYAKTSLIKIIKIFNNLFTKNYEALNN